MSKPVVVLFDVDETLVHTGGAGAKSWMAAFDKLHGASEQYRVLPGVRDTLLGLSDAGVTLGIVSGAMDGAARTKLVPANLNRFFVFGAYGSDSPDRAELTRLAIDKATRLHGAKLDPAQVYVVGDTPHDMEATRAAGAVAVGVASGHYSTDELEATGGVHVLGSLEDPFPGL